MHESQAIRRLLADGWQYSVRQMEFRGDRFQPCLVFRRNGVETRMFSSLTYTSEAAAWNWCDSWAHRALLWTDNPDQGVIG